MILNYLTPVSYTHLTKTELRRTTYSNYLYTWNHFIRDTFGKKKVKDVKYSDVLFFYTDLIDRKSVV